MKRSVAIAMLVVLALVVSACGQAQTPVVKEVPVEVTRVATVQVPVVQTVVVPGPTSVATRIVEKEVTKEPVEIRWATEDAMCPKGADFVGAACAQYWGKQYEKTHPNVRVQVTMVAPLDGTSAQMDAYILAGLNPNVLMGYAGRVGKYRNFAVGLPYEAAKWRHPAIDGWLTPEGKLAIYPIYAWAVTMQANYTYAKELGIDNLLPALDGERTWTIDQFKKFAEAAKAKGVRAGMVFAQPGNGSGDYSTDMWGLAFGGQLYQGGDFTKLALNSPQWVSAWTFLKSMVDGGFFTPQPWALTDDNFNEDMATRKVLVIAQERAATNAKGDDLRIISYPSADGKLVPFATAPTGILVFDNAKRLKSLGGSADAIAKAQASQDAAVEFAQWLATGEYAQQLVTYRGWTWRTDLTMATPVTSDKDSPQLKASLAADWAWMQKMATRYGLSDIGTGSVYYGDLRLLKVQALADVLQGKKTPAQSLADLVVAFGKLVAK